MASPKWSKDLGRHESGDLADLARLLEHAPHLRSRVPQERLAR
jgi:hypothetical protein